MHFLLLSFAIDFAHIVCACVFLSSDPDIRVNDNDVRRVASRQPHRVQHKYQHVYLLVLYGLLALKSVLLDDFSALAEGKIGNVTLAKMTVLERVVFWGGKAFFFSYALVAPLIWSQHSVLSTLLLLLLGELVCGWLLAFMFQVAHVQSEVDWFVKDGKSNAVVRDHDYDGDATLSQQSSSSDKVIGWGEGQVLTSADFCHDSFFWTHVSGGLNYQIVHHLFPGICHCHYPMIAPVIKKTCEEFGIRYTHYTTFVSALSSHVKHLKAMGKALHSTTSSKSDLLSAVPSLHTVG